MTENTARIRATLNLGWLAAGVEADVDVDRALTLVEAGAAVLVDEKENSDAKMSDLRGTSDPGDADEPDTAGEPDTGDEPDPGATDGALGWPGSR